MINVDIKNYKKTDKIDIKCDECNKWFKRPVHVYLKLNEKWNNDFCLKCSIGKTNRSKEKNDKCSATAKNKMLNMTKEERSEKYGNEMWKTNKLWLERMGNNNGYGDAIKNTVSKMSKEERSEKYGHSGKNNGMYGKPPDYGSGIGYSGWYNNLFFRSKMELSFILDNIDNHIIENAEDKFSIKYEVDKKTFTYRPDFLIDNFQVVEVKPSKLLNNGKNIYKIKSAKKYFENKEYSYKILTEKDFPVISFDILYDMYNTNKVELTTSSKGRLLKKYENKTH